MIEIDWVRFVSAFGGTITGGVVYLGAVYLVARVRRRRARRRISEIVRRFHAEAELEDAETQLARARAEQEGDA